jgi:creatinine amidohydrolase
LTLNSHRLELLTQPEVAHQLKSNPLVILPAGSIEQHGPHLPAGTDIFAANLIAERVAEKMNGLVIPGGPLGVTPFHMPFEATITLTHETYISVVYETCRSLAQHGAKQLILLNWHEGNSSSLAIAAERLHRECGLSVLTVQACYVAEELYGPTSGGLTHGGEIETLAILSAHPELVHLDQVEYSSDVDHGLKMDKLRRTRAYQPILSDIRAIAPTGWYGDPKKATIERGQQMVEDLAAAISVRAEEIFLLLDEVNGGLATLDRLKGDVS